MTHILQTEENSTAYMGDRGQNYRGPSISAAYRRSYAESRPAENSWNRIGRNSTLLRIGMGSGALVAMIFFWIMFF